MILTETLSLAENDIDRDISLERNDIDREGQLFFLYLQNLFCFHRITLYLVKKRKLITDKDLCVRMFLTWRVSFR